MRSGEYLSPLRGRSRVVREKPGRLSEVMTAPMMIRTILMLDFSSSRTASLAMELISSSEMPPL